jgi:carbon-monoxide dehydrogenase large subunit
MDYTLPRATDLPFMSHDWAPTDSPNSLINAKGVGELSTIGAGAVVVNAVMDALAGHGVTHVDKPLTAGKIWHALNGR